MTPSHPAAVRWAVATDPQAQRDIEAALTSLRDLATQDSPEHARWGRALHSFVAACETLRYGCPNPGPRGRGIVLEPMANREIILREAFPAWIGPIHLETEKQT